MFKVRNNWTCFTPCSSVSIVNFEQINADWVKTNNLSSYVITQQAFICSKSTIETSEHVVKSIQS